MAKFSMSTQGELFTITKELREAVAAQGAPIPENVIGIVRWKRVDDDEQSMTLRKLTGRGVHHAAPAVPEPAARRASSRNPSTG